MSMILLDDMMQQTFIWLLQLVIHTAMSDVEVEVFFYDALCVIDIQI
jgi:hypothetical protein